MQHIFLGFSVHNHRYVLICPVGFYFYGALSRFLHRQKVEFFYGKHLIAFHISRIGNANGYFLSVLKLETSKVHHSAPMTHVVVKPDLFPVHRNSVCGFCFHWKFFHNGVGYQRTIGSGIIFSVCCRAACRHGSGKHYCQKGKERFGYFRDHINKYLHVNIHITLQI